ncbi:MAG TPA: DUF695 domain-containing protein [Flavisolibacter sp.]|jgi:hypothetical protein|nr:DUF695 domain-containing protein [Flavisolibacter sp.]
MRKFIVYYFFLTSYYVASAQQDDGQWDVYMAQYEKGVGSTVINMGLKSKAPDKSFRFLLSTGVHFSDCNSDGFPSQAEFQKLYVISDSVKRIVDLNVSNIMAGTFTYQCDRKDYYYIKDTNNIRLKLSALYKKQFPGYQPIINIREDASWEAYLTFLYPNEETMEYMNNEKVVTKLREAGDKLDKERQVDHWLYFSNAKSRDSFIVYAKAKDFKIESKETREGAKPFQLHISRVDIVDLPSISKLTLELRREARKYDGDYDGWEAFVVR